MGLAGQTESLVKDIYMDAYDRYIKCFKSLSGPSINKEVS